jgi:tetratricopeptide (TPR) repeat protein
MTSRTALQSELLKMGHNLLAWGKPADALKVFELCIENDSASDRAYAAMGRAHRALGQNEQALHAFQRAVVANPWNRDARSALDVGSAKNPPPDTPDLTAGLLPPAS